MSEVVILTDSVAQIPPDLAQQYHIGVIPLSVIIEEKAYKDGVDILPAELYQRMRTEGILPRTSQPSLGEYLDFFRGYLEKDTQSVIYFALTAKYSGAFSTATKAAHLLEEEYPGKAVVIFDTGTATIAQGLIVIHAARAVQKGANVERVVDLAQEECSKVGFVAMLETLTYLERGGRIGKAAYLVGNLMNVKPILTIDEEGMVAPVGNIRGEKKVVEKLVDCMANRIGDRIPAQIAVMHADELEKAVQLKNLVQERFNLEEILITDFTPVMGAHAGPGVIGLGYQLE